MGESICNLNVGGFRNFRPTNSIGLFVYGSVKELD